MLGVGGGWSFDGGPIGAGNGHPGFPDMDAVSRSQDSTAVAETCCIWIGIQPPDAGQGWSSSQGSCSHVLRLFFEDADECTSCRARWPKSSTALSAAPRCRGVRGTTRLEMLMCSERVLHRLYSVHGKTGNGVVQAEAPRSRCENGKSGRSADGRRFVSETPRKCRRSEMPSLLVSENSRTNTKK
jgi:hypothetical protein